MISCYLICGNLGAYLDGASPLVGCVASNVQTLLLLHLMLLVDDLNDDEAHAAGNAHAHQYKDARHVLEAQRVRCLLEEFAVLLHVPMEYPLFVQFLHEATCNAVYAV